MHSIVAFGEIFTAKIKTKQMAEPNLVQSTAGLLKFLHRRQIRFFARCIGLASACPIACVPACRTKPKNAIFKKLASRKGAW